MEISVNATVVNVGDTVTVVGMPVKIGLPLYRPYIDPALVAEATYNGQVNWFESHEGLPFELVSTSATASRVQFSIGMSSEIHSGYPDHATWGERSSEIIMVTVIQSD